jgi:para-nitrobenzyl esterase
MNNRIKGDRMSTPRKDLRFTEPNALRRKILQGAAGALLLPALPLVSSCARGPADVDTAYGRVRGIEEGATKVFKGIPYGADTATTRFQRPAAPAPWSGVREATAYGPRCPQLTRPDSGPRRLLSSWAVPQQDSEDCLYLNVWTPSVRDNAKRPVMVWLHGGGFASGSGAARVYEGNRLAEKGDVVVVTVNHRLNIFGYLCLAEFSEEFADSGNAGQHDLVAALAWVRDNIAEFGGDPANVTVFGESGGGAKICTLLDMDEAKGLFHRAIVQSGPMLWAAEMESAAQTAQIAVDHFAATDASRFKSASTDEIMQALDAIMKGGRFRTLAPVIDGRGLTRHPFEPDAPPVARDVPLMIGHTATESTFLLGFDETLFALDWQQLPGKIKPFVGDVDPPTIVEGYRDAFPGFSASDVFFDVTTMQMLARNSMRIADRKAEQSGAPVFAYELAFETDIEGGKWRSPHTLDIPLVFDNVQKSQSMFADLARAQQVADTMSSAWLAFARSGHPDSSGNPDWPAWNEARPTMMFDTETAVVLQPRKHHSEILKDIPYWDITGPNTI